MLVKYCLCFILTSWPCLFRFESLLEESDNPQELTHFATSVVAPKQLTEHSLKAKDIGKCHMEEFATSRLETKEKKFWDSITQLNILPLAVCQNRES